MILINKMGEKTMKIKGIFLLFMISGLLVACNPSVNIPEARKALADSLGVSIEEFPPETAFPASYFESLLQVGMSRDEVHQIITGYTKVYYCSNKQEVYYYFETDDDTAFRFKVWYSETGQYVRIEGEDSDSKYWNMENCNLGLIE